MPPSQSSLPSGARMQQRHFPPGRRSPSECGIVKPRGALHLLMCSLWVHACHTRLTGASNRRVMTSVRSSSVETLFLAAMFRLLLGLPRLLACRLALLFRFLRLQLAQIDIEAVEALFPKAAIILQPVVDRLERIHLDAARAPLRFAATRDQTGALQDLQVLRDGRQAH